MVYLWMCVGVGLVDGLVGVAGVGVVEGGVLGFSSDGQAAQEQREKAQP